MEKQRKRKDKGVVKVGLGGTVIPLAAHARQDQCNGDLSI